MTNVLKNAVVVANEDVIASSERRCPSMTPGLVGAIAIGAALASDVCIAGLTFICGSWIKDKVSKPPEPTTKPQSKPREFVAVRGGGDHD